MYGDIMRIQETINKIWKEHFVAEFPYPDPCFDCNLGDCSGCKHLIREATKEHTYQPNYNLMFRHGGNNDQLL